MKKIIFCILLLVLCFPFINNKLNLWKYSKLGGVTEHVNEPEFNFTNWFSGSYQENYDDFISQNFGLRNFFIRLFNQIDYKAFKRANSNVVIGKDDYLFQPNYIDEYTGKSFIGMENMRAQFEQIDSLKNYLAANNKLLVTLLAPGKTYYYKEFLPDYIAPEKNRMTNYYSILELNKKKDINLLDINGWFLKLKDTSSYPLFSKQGIHWNYYGIALSTDTILKYISSKLNVETPKINWTIEVPDELRGTDYDLGELLNIMSQLPYNKMPYPKFSVNEVKNRKLKVLSIGDSFYWTFQYDNLFKRIFEADDFYYYSNTVYPENATPSRIPADLDLFSELAKYDVVLLVQSTPHYSQPGLGFVQLFSKQMAYYKKYKREALIKIESSNELKELVINMTVENNITADSAREIICDSLAKARLKKISEIKVKMRNSSEWLSYIKEKSRNSNISLEDAMHGDAEWTIINEESRQ